MKKTITTLAFLTLLIPFNLIQHSRINKNNLPIQVRSIEITKQW